MAFSPEQYTILIREEQVEGDTYVVGRVTEFPDAVVYEESGPAAYEAIVAVLADLIEHLREIGKEVPAPLIPEEFSGRVTFRMPRSLHARVDARAQLEGVSINTWLVAAAENYLGTTGQVVKYSTSNAHFGGDSISGVAMMTSLTSGNEMAVAIMKSAIVAANTSFTPIKNVMIGGASSMGDFDEPEPEAESRGRQH